MGVHREMPSSQTGFKSEDGIGSYFQWVRLLPTYEVAVMTVGVEIERGKERARDYKVYGTPGMVRMLGHRQLLPCIKIGQPARHSSHHSPPTIG